MARTRLIKLGHRIYADFLMPSRLPTYSRFLEEVLRRGYTICSVARFWDKINDGQVHPGDKYFVLRHDVDTDVATAKEMWQIERALGIRSSYYFRLSTLDIPFMQEVAHSQGEASYHYEELASVAKQKRLKSREEVLREMPGIRKLFHEHLTILRNKSGLPLNIVASHGDFVNRKLRTYNWEILKDSNFRKTVGVDLEVYDDDFVHNISSRHSDNLYPSFWTPGNPLGAIRDGSPKVQVLVHPRHWRSNPQVNFVDNMYRVFEGVRYSL